ncbi:MAG: gliding motility-associated C-terminal domain-containing protein [Bacteroidales bacterium]|nr:gliding motility-associated C-terminal domain-containing protein [Bacteroidales bacterium]
MRFWVTIFFFILPLSLAAQLDAPGKISVKYTSYPSSPAVKDPIFFYCSSLGTDNGSLTAQKSGGTGTYDFSWYKWNNGTGSFSDFIISETGKVTSTIANRSAGGYRVEIDSSGIEVETLTGWIFFDTPPIAEARLDEERCNRVALDGDTSATTKNFYYNDPVTKNSVTQKNEINFLWSSTPTSIIPLPSFKLDPITYSPPLEDVTYKLTVNSLGCSSEASFFYAAIRALADFSVDPVEGEAPLEVSFTDKSIRGAEYTWDFGDGTDTTLKDPPPHIYYKPGEYWVTLDIVSELFCTDAADSIKITVEPSELDIPNVFTPDDDGYNDRFRIESKSLRYVSMEVFSQSGLKIYGFSGEGERLKSWDGWDGKINNSSTKARPGIYFYIIRAFGWDDVKYDSKEYRGFVYLYR